MERISDDRLETLAKLFTTTARERMDEDVASALTELRERRAMDAELLKATTELTDAMNELKK
jgi:hypothetical protein